MSAARSHRQHITNLLRLLALYEMEKESEKKEDEKKDAEVKPPQHTYYVPTLSYIATKLTNLATNITDLATGNGDVNEKLDQLCDTIKQEVISCNSPQKFIALIYLLSEKALEAQFLKKRAGESRCCEIFHAMRSYIISFMKNDDGKFKEAFDAEITRLKIGPDKQEQIGLEIPIGLQHLFKARLVNKTKMTEINDEINKTYFKLASLQDYEGIAEACRNKLLGQEFPYPLLTVREKEKELPNKKSVCRETKVDGIPYCYQDDFDHIHYADRYQITISVSYDEFKSEDYTPKFSVNIPSTLFTPPPQRKVEDSTTNTHEEKHKDKKKLGTN